MTEVGRRVCRAGPLIQLQASGRGFLRKAPLEMKQDFWEAEIRKQDPKTILVIKLVIARSGWIWRTDWCIRQGLPLRSDWGSWALS